MAPTTDEPVLFPDLAGPPAGVVVLNDRCRLQERDGYRVVSVCGLPVMHFAVGDRAGEAHAMVSLVDLGWARQSEAARAFGCDVRTVRRYQRRFEEGGLGALGRPRGFPRGRSRVPQSRKDAVNRWKAEGVSNREIGRRLGIDENSVRKLAPRLGWQELAAEQRVLPLDRADPKLSGLDHQEAGGPRKDGGLTPDPEVDAVPAGADQTVEVPGVFQVEPHDLLLDPSSQGLRQGGLAHLAGTDQAHDRKLAQKVLQAVQMARSLDHQAILP